MTHTLTGPVGAEVASAAVAAWSAGRGQGDSVVLGLLQQVAVHTPVVVFTNATTVLEDDLRAAGLTGEFAAAVSSARTRTAVPAAAAAFTAAEQAIAVVATHRRGPVRSSTSAATPATRGPPGAAGGRDGGLPTPPGCDASSISMDF